MSYKVFHRFASLILALAISFAGFTPAFAAPPSNDNFADATVIGGLPYYDFVDNTEATRETDEPQNCSGSAWTIWYSFTPTTDTWIQVDMAGSSFSDTILAVFEDTGAGLGGLSLLDCMSWGDYVHLSVQAEKTYYFQVGSIYSQGNLQINLQEIPPLLNDNFVNATEITSLPFSGTVDNKGATVELDEPQNCSSPWTVWYSFTPTTNALIMANTAGGSLGDTTLGIYQQNGFGLGGLSFLNCAGWGDSVTFNVQAGTTYYIQLGSIYNRGILQINLWEILPPPNDNFANASIINTLPFDDTVQFNQATSREEGEPLCMDNGTPARTIWYSFTPATSGVASVGIPWAEFSPMLGVYTGTSLGSLTQIGCQYYSGNTYAFQIDAGTTYYIQVAKLYPWEWDGQIQIHLEIILPPPNDNFADSKVIPSLPYDDSVDTKAAGREIGEPKPSCASDQWNKTAWYAFTPNESGSFTASIPWANFAPVLAMYTGSSLTELQELGCRLGENLIFYGEAGVTYYFQSGANWNDGGPVAFHLDVTPPPTTWFWFTPSDPTIFDSIQFDHMSYDPANVGFKYFAWDFGDGATSSEWNPVHKYSADGDYTVNLTVVTYDGRMASSTQTVSVRTHDVAVTKISAPQSANSGQTRQIVVYMNNKRYDETVRVDLYKSGPSGFEWIGFYTQFVPVRSANRTTPFTFNYTFTTSDARIGKITFKATATIIGARDAWIADNELISSPPTKVTR